MLSTNPSWLLLADDYTEVEIGSLKAGKEAQIFVMKRVSGDRSCLVAHKRYIPMKVAKGDLEAGGFERSRTFTRDAPYWEDKRMKRRAHRERRAVAKRTEFGRSLVFSMWARHEYATLTRLWAADVPVPYPIDHDSESVTMEYFGDRERAAPQLVQARLGPAELRDAYEQWVEAMRRMVRAGIVHADLSPYNIMWWRGRLIVIDLPQAVDLLGHPDGFSLLHRDVENVATWFRRKGVPADADAVFADLIGHI